MSEAETTKNLEENADIQKLIDIFASNGRTDQALDISRTAWLLDGLVRQRDSALQELQSAREELRDIKEQLEQMTESQAEIVDDSFSVIKMLESMMERLNDLIHSARDKLLHFAQNTLDSVKGSGISALDKAASALNLRDTLGDIQETVQASVAAVKSAVERSEKMGAELRSAGNHIKNAGRAAAGKELRQAGSEQEGRFQMVALAPIRALHKAVSGINNTTLAAISAVEHLEQAADARRPTHLKTQRPMHLKKKPSLRQRLVKGKTEAAKNAPLPEKNKKAVEAAL